MDAQQLRMRAATHRAIHANRMLLYGTSEGCMKAWDTRRTDKEPMRGDADALAYVSEASGHEKVDTHGAEAGKLTAAARESAVPKAHVAASEAHITAKKVAKKAGLHTRAEAHGQLAREHRQEAARIKQQERLSAERLHEQAMVHVVTKGMGSGD
jgi:hypothetical protein